MPLRKCFHDNCEERYGVRYIINCIEDSDSKMYEGVVDAKPYGDAIQINKKECIGYV